MFTLLAAWIAPATGGRRGLDQTLESLEARRVTYPSAGRELAGYLFVPPGDGPFPALVINHGSNGLPPASNAWIKDVASAMHQFGYVTFFPVRRGYDENPGPHFTSFRTAPVGSEAWGHQTVEALSQETDDVLAALAWLASQPQVDPERLVLMGSSFGGIVTVFAAARPSRARAAVSFATAAMVWHRAPAMQAALLAAVGQAKVPLFLIQAANDFTLAPLYAMGAELARQGKPHEARVYAAVGSTNLDGHVFIRSSVAVWGPDVQRFLDRWLGGGAARA